MTGGLQVWLEGWPDIEMELSKVRSNRLATWRLTVRDSVNAGSLKEIASWLERPARGVLLEDEGRDLAHPSEIVETLQDLE